MDTLSTISSSGMSHSLAIEDTTLEETKMLRNGRVLNKSYVDLSSIGHERATYLLKQSKKLRCQVEIIWDSIAEREWNSVESFVVAYHHQSDRTVTRDIQAMSQCYTTIFESLSRNWSGAFTDPVLKQRFPNILSWIWRSSGFKSQRNKCAHCCCVSAPFKWDEDEDDDPDFYRVFDPEEFWTNVMEKQLPWLYYELEDLIAILEEDLPSIPETGPPYTYKLAIRDDSVDDEFEQWCDEDKPDWGSVDWRQDASDYELTSTERFDIVNYQLPADFEESQNFDEDVSIADETSNDSIGTNICAET